MKIFLPPPAIPAGFFRCSFKVTRAALFTGLFFAGIFQTAYATITIDSIRTTISNCPNNGTAKIYARSTRDSAIFLYNTISGPVIYPLQNDSLFNALYPGTYTGWVHDANSFDSTFFTFTITGTYHNIEFTPIGIAPFCSGQGNGEIIAPVTTGTGLPNYTWQIISPFIGGITNSEPLTGLSTGTYVVRVGDACGEARTQTVFVDQGGSGLGNPFAEFQSAGCNEYELYLYFNLNNNYSAYNLTLSIVTDTDSVIAHVSPQPYDIQGGSGIYYITASLHNINPGSYLHICLTDTCGVTICLYGTTVPPFAFYLNTYLTNTNCVSGYTGYLYSVSCGNCLNFPPYSTDFVIVTDSATGQVVDSSSNGTNVIPPLTGGQTYNITVRNACGDSYMFTIVWPQAPGIGVGEYIKPVGCLDSTADVSFILSGFASGVTVTFLSGPPVLESTKPGYAYRDTIIYPLSFQSSTFYAGFAHMPPGNYVFTISDSCGDSITGSLMIPYNGVSSLGTPYQIRYYCGGVISLSYPLLQEMYTNALYDMQTLGYIQPDSSNPWIVFRPLLGGTYVIETNYTDNSGFADVGFPQNYPCWSAYDTVTIRGTTDSTIAATDFVTCNGISYIHVNVDTQEGIPPFQYEIISGPQTFPPQDSSIFVVGQFGTYLVGVIDSCGDIDARYITSDSGRITPVIRSGGLCPGSSVTLSELASPYYTYHWKAPNGTVTIANSITFNPFMDADTGLYYITKIININSCIDSIHGYYELGYQDTFQRAFGICPGDTLIVGSHHYSQAGTYYDTLSTAYNCDSIQITTLNFLTAPTPLISADGSPVCHSYPLILFASGGIGYSWSNGLYGDTIYSSDEYDTVTYSVTAIDAGGCTASTSIVIFPVRPDSSSKIQGFCPGDTFYVGSHFYTTPGSYLDTLLSSLGCDSFVYTTLQYWLVVVPAITPDTFPVCYSAQFDTVTAGGGHSYTWSDGRLGDHQIFPAPDTETVYTVTVTSYNYGCTASASITLYPSTPDTIFQADTICAGGTFYVGTHAYTIGGAYTDPATTPYGCPTLIYTNLTVSSHFPLQIIPYNSPVCHSGPVTLVAIGGSNYRWSNLADTAAITVNPSTLTTYSVTATDTGVCSATASASVVVYPAHEDSVFQSPSICVGDTFRVGADAYTQSGYYINILIGRYGCDSLVFTTLTVLNGLYAGIEPAYPPVCHAGPITLTASGGARYAWSNLADSSVITVNPDTISTYTVTVTTGSNCSASASVLVYPARQDSVVQSPTICSGDTFYVGSNPYTQTGDYIDILNGQFGCDSIVYTFLTVLPGGVYAVIVPAHPPLCHSAPDTLTAHGGDNFSWSPGGWTDSIVTVNPTVTTVYTVTVSNNGSCSATASVTVYPVSADSFTLNQSKTIICPGDSAIICAAQGYITYNWSNGSNTRCITTPDAGNYNVTATNSLGCAAASNSAHLAIYNPAPVTISVSGDTLTSYPAVSYQWYRNNSAIPGDTGITIIAVQPGSYKVEVTDSNGCPGVSSAVVTGPDNVLEGDYIRIYPNPNTGAFVIEFQDNSPREVTVTDVLGRALFVPAKMMQKAEFDLSAMPPGVYILRSDNVFSGAPAVYKQVVVQR